MAQRKAALLVATYRYQDAELRQLTAPGQDAEALAAVLRNPEIAGFDDVNILLNQPHHVVGEAISEFYRNRRRDDLTLLYFTGHGLKDDQGRLYLAMTNTKRSSLLFSGLSAQQINEAMDSCASRRNVLVLDCCYSGAFPADRIAKSGPQVNTLEKFQGKGRVVLAASDSTQYAFEGSRLTGHGTQSVFTHFLVEGLTTGKGDINEDGDITLDELYSYVYDHVTEETPQQRPVKLENVEGRIVIARNIHWRLPAYIQNALDSPVPQDRLTVLENLARLHRAGNEFVKAEVINQIHRLTQDDSRAVSTSAMERIATLNPGLTRREAKEQPHQQTGDQTRQPAEEHAPRGTERQGGPYKQEAGEWAPRKAERRSRVAGFMTRLLRSAKARWAADGQQEKKAPAGGLLRLLASWGLDQPKRRRMVLAASAGLGLISLAVFLVVTISRPATSDVTATIPVGNSPFAVGITPDGRQAYVTNTGSHDVSVIDTANNTVTATIPVDATPMGVAVTSDGGHAYVANQDSNTVSVIDTVSNTVTSTIPVGTNPRMIAITPDGGHMYVTNDISNDVSVIDTASNAVTGTIPVGANPEGVAVTPDGDRVYVTNYNSSSVSVIDTASNSVTATIPVGTNPWGMAVTRDGGHAYVANHGSNSVSVIDTASNSVTATIPIGLGTAPRGVALTPNGRLAYVINNNSSTVSVIDTASNAITATVSVGASPNLAAVTPDGRYAYIPSANSNNVSVIEISTEGAASTGLERFYEQELAWSGCSTFATIPRDREVYADPGLQCAYLEVPLDYARPNGQTVQVGLLRRPASDPANRIGSLLVNPGGPGASGMSSAAGLINQITNNELGRRFDFVGFDPRGIGSSKPQVICRTTEEQEAERLMNLHVDTSPAGVERTESQEENTNAGCVSRTGADVLAHIGTREVIRDLDIMRSALGDAKLTYLGYSYGARIGIGYAEAFPGNVRAMILDGATNPAQDLTTLIIDQGRGFQQAFNTFAAWCAEREDCALGQDTSQAVNAFRDRVLPLIDRPVEVSGGRKLSYTDAISGVFLTLYDSDRWTMLNQGVQELTQGRGETLMRLADLSYDRLADGTYSTAADAFLAVRCVDDPPVTDRNVARDIDAQFRAVAPFLDTGRAPSPALDNCAFWPVPPTGGPHQPDITGLPSVVVISTTDDPFAPYQAGVTVARDLKARLLTFDGTQHTVFLQGIGCVDNAGISYLTTLELPPEGTRC